MSLTIQSTYSPLSSQKCAGAALAVIATGSFIWGASMFYDTVKGTGGKMARKVVDYVASVNVMAIGAGALGVIHYTLKGK